MNELGRLTYNESLKIVKKKRFLVVLLILVVLIPLFVYAQMKQTQTLTERLDTKDWRVIVQQQIVDYQNRLSSARIPEEWKQHLQLRVEQLQYFLNHDINPTQPGAPTFVREFLAKSSTLFLPLLVMVVATDLVSGEHGEGTIKLLLTRPVRRWKILLSKLLSMLLFVSLIVAATAAFSYVMSGVVFGYRGWNDPTLVGFQVANGNLVTEGVRLIPQWKYILMTGGLVWFVSMVVAAISVMLSVLIRSTAASMGVMLAALIAGNILTGMASSWEEAKYLFMVNLQLTDYLSGQMPPIEGMTLPFSLTVLSIWGLAALVAAFFTFIRQDIY